MQKLFLMDKPPTASSTSTTTPTLEEVRTSWQRHWGRALTLLLFGATDFPDIRLSQAWLDQIWKQYSEPQRHYHTVVHVWEMLEWWLPRVQEWISTASAEKKKKRNDPETCDHSIRILIWATFFHDAIYDPTRSDNEIQSANLFDECWDELTMAMKAAATDKQDLAKHVQIWNEHHFMIRTLILATERHTPILSNCNNSDGTSSSESVVGVSLQEFFLDTDMAVLGKSPWNAYEIYAKQIRQEYQHVDPKTYCEKRAEILQGFLKKDHLYYRPEFQGLLEEAARRNLANEVTILRKGLIPRNT